MPENGTVTTLQATLYAARNRAARLRREVYSNIPTGPDVDARLGELLEAEADLAALDVQSAALTTKDRSSGLLLTVGQRQGGVPGVLGAETTGVEARVHQRMSHVSTAMVHLLNAEDNPLLTCEIRNYANHTRRMRVTSFIEGYTARAIDTREIPAGPNPVEIKQLPTFFPQAIKGLNELTRATLNVLVEELGEAAERVESHSTHPVWLLARNTAPMAVRDPKTGKWVDLSRYLGAFVTPNAPELLTFLNQAADLHPQKQLPGYQGDAAQVEPQVRSIFEALKTAAGIRYVNSIIAFGHGDDATNQRVRLPRESLLTRQANCIDGTVLYASLLEAISLNPAIVIIPGHAFLGWQTWTEVDASWNFLDTTMTASNSFDEARARGDILAAQYRKMAEIKQTPDLFKLWPLRKLRSDLGITPLE